MWQKSVDILVYDLLKLSTESVLGRILNFIIYDFFKILFLIFIVISIISFIRTYIDNEKLHKFMHKKMYGLNYLAASVLGAVTPFCSCSGIPIFVGFLEAGIPLGVAITFLVTSPLVNEVIIILLGNYYGWKIAITYGLAGIVLGIISGNIISALKLEKEIIFRTKCSCEGDCGCAEEKTPPKTFKERAVFAWSETKITIKQLYKYIFLGVLLGGIIQDLIPREVLMNYVGGTNWWAVPLAVIIGVPIYAGCSTVAPAIFSITAQGGAFRNVASFINVDCRAITS